MVKSSATTVEEYLEELPADRRETIETVRKVVLENLPDGYEESMNWGMISYEIPLSRYPKTYNKQPLGYAALASQKNYCTLYLMTAYAHSEQEKKLREAFAKAGKKLDMGKCCIRFKTAADLPLDAIGEAVASSTPEHYIESYEQARR